MYAHATSDRLAFAPRPLSSGVDHIQAEQHDAQWGIPVCERVLRLPGNVRIADGLHLVDFVLVREIVKESEKLADKADDFGGLSLARELRETAKIRLGDGGAEIFVGRQRLERGAGAELLNNHRRHQRPQNALHTLLRHVRGEPCAEPVTEHPLPVKGLVSVQHGVDHKKDSPYLGEINAAVVPVDVPALTTHEKQRQGDEEERVMVKERMRSSHEGVNWENHELTNILVLDVVLQGIDVGVGHIHEHSHDATRHEHEPLDQALCIKGDVAAVGEQPPAHNDEDARRTIPKERMQIIEGIPTRSQEDVHDLDRGDPCKEQRLPIEAHENLFAYLVSMEPTPERDFHVLREIHTAGTQGTARANGRVVAVPELLKHFLEFPGVLARKAVCHIAGKHVQQAGHAGRVHSSTEGRGTPRSRSDGSQGATTAHSGGVPH
mmetsp:Transcript_20499/g.56897  ORF Transcript_20499/g.56897 Transcript_20499/m.56897 type:complete len:435 (+) Transcript_20499:219-1523(+)